MPINKDIFRKASTEAAEKEMRKGIWRVYEEYEVLLTDKANVPGLSTRHNVYAQAAGGFVGQYQEYYPLVSQQSLFLRFARLGDEGEVTQDVWRDWIREYGVLGLEQHDLVRDTIEDYRQQGLGFDELLAELNWLDDRGRWDFRQYSVRMEGGPSETYQGFIREAYKASRLLKIYEAATDPDGPNIRTIKQYADQEDSNKGIETAKDAKAWALAWVGYQVHETIAEDCYPALYQVGNKLSQGWGFHTLLGAMYLQMAWLMTAKEEIRCKWCGRVVNFEQPDLPVGKLGQKGFRKDYKPRVDREFCDNRKKCYNAWYYEHITKPKRESERT